MFRSALVSPKMFMLVTKRKTLIGVCFARLSLLVDGTMSFMDYFGENPASILIPLSKLHLSRPSWNWRKRSSIKITERTYEEGTEAFHTRRKRSHLEAASCGQSTRLGAV